MLFSDRSILTMIHGLVLSGGALILLIVALVSLRTIPAGNEAPANGSAKTFAWVTTAAAIFLWLAVIGGTYIVFPLYRAAPPEGLTQLAEYPRALLLADPQSRWLHSFGMEIKEHMPWIAAMLTTAAAFIARSYSTTLAGNASLRRVAGSMLGASVIIVASVALLGVFINKVAPLW